MVKPKTKLLLDENIGLLVETALHRAGFDVVSVIKTMRGASDATVIKRAQKENRIVVTLDRDFGYLVHQTLHQHAGVVYLRLKDESPKSIIKVLKKFTRQFPEIINKFTKITENRIIIRPRTSK